MKLTIFAAWIDIRRQIREKLAIKESAGKCSAENMGINTAQDCLETQRDEVPGQFSAVPLPEWEHAVEPIPKKPFLAITANVFQENIAADD
jgi:hypothetical protein